MSIDAWDEIRTAFHVARLGTVSGAAEVLGVHHATVIRHIDALEDRLGTKLFQRHSRGYTATEAGRDLMQVAQTTDEQFSQLVSRLKGRGDTVSGELVVTSVESMSPLLVPVLAGFQALHPGLQLRFLTDVRLFRLEYGEAHVAIRAGAVPDEPDNVVQKLAELQTAIYAAPSYLERRGMPADEAQLLTHDFIGADGVNQRAPYYRWMEAEVPQERVVMRTSSSAAACEAVRAGMGLGFMTEWETAGAGELVQVAAPRPEWASQLWLVTHVDLHRTAKVQAILSHLKTQARLWGDSSKEVHD